MAALQKLGDIVGNRSSACGCPFGAEASVHGRPQRDAAFGVGEQKRGRETSCRCRELGGELPPLHLVFRGLKPEPGT